MTTFELTKQPLSLFEHAGRTAFSMLILKTANPYPKTDKNGVAEPSNLAWDRGYDAASNEAFQKEHPSRPRGERKPMPRPNGRKPEVRKPASSRGPINPPRFVKVARGN
jgi:hypothetical protein